MLKVKCGSLNLAYSSIYSKFVINSLQVTLMMLFRAYAIDMESEPYVQKIVCTLCLYVMLLEL
jgi:hypothetical protein